MNEIWDLAERTEQAARVLDTAAAEQGNAIYAAHLTSKAEGVRLVLSYLREHARAHRDREEAMSAEATNGEARETGTDVFTDLLITHSNRSAALDYAIQFHRNAGTDDPKTVVETAEEFLVFLDATDPEPAGA